MANKYIPDPYEEEKEKENEEEFQPKKKGGGLTSKIVAFLLGFVFAFGALGGTIFAAYTYVMKLPIGETVEKIDGGPNGEIYKLLFGDGTPEVYGYLDPKFAEMKVEELLGPVTDMTEELLSGNGSLGTIEQVSPQIKKFAEFLTENFALAGIEVDPEKLLDMPFSAPSDATGDSPASLVEYLIDCCYTSPIATLLGNEKYGDGKFQPFPNDLMMILCYGEKGVDYDLVTEDGVEMVVMIEGHSPKTISNLTQDAELLDNFSLTSVMEADPENKLMMYVLYGKKDMHYSVDTAKKITSLQKQVAIDGTSLYNEYGDVALEDCVLKGTTSYIQNDVTYTLTPTGKTVKIIETGNDGALYYVSDSEGNPVNFKPTTIGDLTKADSPLNKITSRLTLGELMTIDEEDTLLYNLKDETVDSLPDAIQNLKIKEILKGAENNTLLKCLPDDTTIDNLAEKIEDITINNLFEDQIYDAENNVTGVWKYILKNPDYVEGSLENEYLEPTISEMGSIITNMTENIQNTTIKQLDADGIMDMGDPNDPDSLINKEILTKVTITVPGTSFGGITVPSTKYEYELEGISNEIKSKGTIGNLTVSLLSTYLNQVVASIANIDLNNAHKVEE